MNSTATELLNSGPLMTGPAVIGITLNWWLYGILMMQYYIYFSKLGKDHKFLRMIVHFIFLLDTVQTIASMADAFHWFVYGFGDPMKLYDINLASINVPCFDSIIAFIIQLVYCWRVWILGRWRVVPIIIAFLALVAFVNGMFLGILDAVLGSILKFKWFNVIPLYLWLFASAATDITIAGSMTYLLLKFKSGSNANTVALVKRILILTLETNALTALNAIVIIVVLFIKPTSSPMTNFHLPSGYIMGKLYSNCFMVLLNQRHFYERSRVHSSTDEIGATINASNSETRTIQLGHSQKNIGNTRSGSRQLRSFGGGEISVIKFANPPRQADSVISDSQNDLEMGGLERETMDNKMATTLDS